MTHRIENCLPSHFCSPWRWRHSWFTSDWKLRETHTRSIWIRLFIAFRLFGLFDFVVNNHARSSRLSAYPSSHFDHRIGILEKHSEAQHSRWAFTERKRTEKWKMSTLKKFIVFFKRKSLLSGDSYCALSSFDTRFKARCAVQSRGMIPPVY